MKDFFTKAGLVAERGYSPLPVINKICPVPGWPMAACDERDLEIWSRKWPTADVAIRCSGLCVIDVDPRNGGLLTLAEWLGNHESMHTYQIVSTKNSGLHYYFTLPEREITKKNFVGIDIKAGRGAYVVAPPSKGYEWIGDSVVSKPLPQWLESQLCRPNLSEIRNTTGSVSPHVVASWMKTHKHGRNNQLYRLAIMCQGDLTLLREAAEETGLTPREIERTINSALKAKSS